MAFLFPTLLVVLFLATVLCLLAEGMWSNAIRFINVVFAGLLATNFWEPTARFLENTVSKGGSYWWDFVALWVLFALFVTILQEITNRASRVNVRFLAIVNKSGGIVFACMVAAVLVAFTNFTLHTAPLAEKFCQGGFDSDKPVLLAPDRQWGNFVAFVSAGSLSKFGNSTEFSMSKFVSDYKARRAALEAQIAADKGFGASGAPGSLTQAEKDKIFGRPARGLQIDLPEGYNRGDAETVTIFRCCSYG